MFDTNGGVENVLLAVLNLMVIILIISLSIDKGNKLHGAIIFCVLMSMYGFVFYVANPSLSFWKV